MLAGELGEKYGKQHEYYNLQTPADAIKLLCINYPALKQDMMQAHHNGVGYKVIQGGAAMGYGELNLPFGSKPLLVVPVITGSGGGTGQILAGVGIVAAAIAFAPVSAGFLGLGQGLAGGFLATGVSSALGSLGAGLILSGTANLISPQPDFNAGRIKGQGTNVRGPGPDGVTRGGMGEQSYAFSGPANTVGTGATLPVIYGQVIAGSHLLAVHLDVSDESDPLKLAIQKPGKRTLKINGEKLTTELQDCGGIDSKRLKPEDQIQGTNRDERVRINETFGPGQSQTLKEEQTYNTNQDSTVSALKYKEDGRRKRLDVLFEINNGLYEYVARPGTTKIDGFITYEVTAFIRVNHANRTLARARITVQGLTNESQSFRYGHRLEMPKVVGEDGEDLNLKVEIIEVGLHRDATFTVHGYGYDRL